MCARHTRDGPKVRYESLSFNISFETKPSVAWMLKARSAVISV